MKRLCSSPVVWMALGAALFSFGIGRIAGSIEAYRQALRSARQPGGTEAQKKYQGPSLKETVEKLCREYETDPWEVLEPNE